MKTCQNAICFLFCLFTLTASGQALSVMSYNLRYDNPNDGPNAWPERRDFLAAQVRFHHPDVFGVQEGLQQQLDYLKKTLPAYTYLGVGRDDGKSGGEYSAIFYQKEKFQVVNAGTFWLSETPETPSQSWDAALPRICTYACLMDTNQQIFWVFNTHFDHVGVKAREASARLILEKIETLNTDHQPVILTGDFNCTPDSAPYKHLSAALLDSRAVSQEPPFGPEGTFNGFVFDKPAANRIDYIFCSSSIKVLRYAVLSDNRDCHYPSDHFPVLVQVKLRD
ncbi:MAG: endonuclease/exonuclease/phosphatase family protein [Lewinellaceae bacterium]|nr:endonuclease/exonuclease/phosphatase family protein [Lewinellaceae bacterium]